MDIWTHLAAFAQIETQRLHLRPFNFADSPAFFEISGASDSLPFIFPRTVTKFESDYLLVHEFLKNPLGIWAITDKQTGQLLGSIRLEKLDWAKRRAELAYFIRREWWGQGVATESLKTLVFLAFQDWGLQSLSIVTHKENLASQQVAKKAGFRLAREFKGSDRYSHRMRQYKEFRLDKRDYRYE